MNPSIEVTISVPISVPILHESSHRLTQTITWHRFRQSQSLCLTWKPGQSLSVRLPEDIDLVGQMLDKESRTLQLTPCNYSDVLRQSQRTIEGEAFVDFVSRDGRISSLIGMPRFEALQAEIVGVWGGFDLEEFSHGNIIAIAGGTGISPFLALSSDPIADVACENRILFWSLHIDDLQFVEYVLAKGSLSLSRWREVRIFLTTGPTGIRPPSAVAKSDQIMNNFMNRDDEASEEKGARTKLEFFQRRVNARDLDNASATGQHKDSPKIIYVCGSKSLQWQIKSWNLSIKAKIVTIQNVDANLKLNAVK
jgi:hypothetical protein